MLLLCSYVVNIYFKTFCLNQETLPQLPFSKGGGTKFLKATLIVAGTVGLYFNNSINARAEKLSLRQRAFSFTQQFPPGHHCYHVGTITKHFCLVWLGLCLWHRNLKMHSRPQYHFVLSIYLRIGTNT